MSKTVSLTTEFREYRRCSSFISDAFVLLPSFNAVISQHEDCLFASSLLDSDITKEILLDSSFTEDVGSEIVRDYFRSNTGKNTTCILNSNEDTLFDGVKYKNKCVMAAGGLSVFNVNTKGNILAVAYCNSILSFYEIASDIKAGVSSGTISESSNTLEGSEYTAKYDGTELIDAIQVDASLDWIYLRLLKSIKTNVKNITSIAYDSSDEYVACGIVDGGVIIYRNCLLYHTFISLDSMVSILRFYPHTLWLIAATQNGDIILYDLNLKLAVAKFEDHMGFITDLAFIVTLDGSPGGFISCGKDTVINFWSLDLRKEFKSIKKRNTPAIKKPFKRIVLFESICSINIVTNHKFSDYKSWLLLVATDNGIIKIINPADDKVVKERECSYGQIGLRSVRRSGDSIISLGLNGSLCIYKDNLDLNRQFVGNLDSIFHFQVYKTIENPDIDLDTDTSDYGHSLEWLRKERLKGLALFFILLGDEIIRILSLSGEYISLGLGSKEYRHTDSILSISYSKSANILASGSKDERIFIWDLNNLTVNTIITIDGLSLAYLVLSNNAVHNNFLLASSGENVIKLFNISLEDKTNDPQLLSGSNAITAVAHKKVINTIVFSPNNKLVATAGGDKTIVIYSVDNLIVRGKCLGHRRSVVSLAFMTTAKMIVSSSVDETIKIWNIADFTCVKTFQGHVKAVMRVLVLLNDMQILSSGIDGLIKLWNIRTSDCILTLDNHDDKVWNIELDDKNMASISKGALIYWDDVTEEVERIKLQREREEVLKCTQIEALSKEGKECEALCLAVEMKKVNMAKAIIMKACNRNLYNNGNSNIFKDWVNRLKLLKNIKERLTTVFDFIQIWISSNKTAWIANSLLYELLNQFKTHEVFEIEGLSHRIDCILTHEATHHSRLMNLMEKSHLLDILAGYNSLPSIDNTRANSLTREILYK